MLEQLIRLTNSDKYIQHLSLVINKIIIEPGQESEMKIVLEIFDDLTEDTQKNKQIWEVVCKSIIYSTTNKIHEPKRPYNRINVYQEHPVLWNYESAQYLVINGPCTNIAELMGDLYIVHDEVCGNWVDFHWLFFSLPKRLADNKQATIEVPKRLLQKYTEVFEKHNLTSSLGEIREGNSELSVLIFGNPDISPDNYCFGQPYIVGKSFEEQFVA